jgi:hypothetical protein
MSEFKNRRLLPEVTNEVGNAVKANAAELGMQQFVSDANEKFSAEQPALEAMMRKTLENAEPSIEVRAKMMAALVLMYEMLAGQAEADEMKDLFGDLEEPGE